MGFNQGYGMSMGGGYLVQNEQLTSGYTAEENDLSLPSNHL